MPNQPTGASRLLIARPVGTALVATALVLVGVLSYFLLPVSSLPPLEYPTINVSAARPGTDPVTMAATVAAPLERKLGEISGIEEMTSSSSLGSTSITIQFDLNRNLDGAARDVQAAINAALTDLPADMPSPPRFHKANPSALPLLILAMTSKTAAIDKLYDVADTVVAQRISRIEGVGVVSLGGAQPPAIRIRVDPIAVAAMGIGLEEVRSAVANANSFAPVGALDGAGLSYSIETNAQLRTPEDYRQLVVKSNHGTAVHLGAVATIDQSVRNVRSAAWFNLEPSVLLIIFKKSDANAIDTTNRIYHGLAELGPRIGKDVQMTVLADSSAAIRASVLDMQYTVVANICLAMFVAYLFFRQRAATVAVYVIIPVVLASTCAMIFVAGLSLNNISLLAIAVSVGFIVDDAIVVVENIFRNLERGAKPLEAAVEGVRQVGFTVIAIGGSLVAAFVPLLFMNGVVGRLFAEFSLTLAFAITTSTIASLALAPTVCALFLRPAASLPSRREHRLVGRLFSWLIQRYETSLAFALNRCRAVLLLLLVTIAFTAALYIQMPKGLFPQDDTGLIFAGMSVGADVSFEAMKELQERATKIVIEDPAVANVGSYVGSSLFGASTNDGRFYISLKPPSERGPLTSQEVIDRLRPKLFEVGGGRVFLVPIHDIRVSSRSSTSAYQFTLWDADSEELFRWAPRILERLKSLPELVDVSSDRQEAGLQANVVIDRSMASRLGVQISDVNNALNDAFSQREIAIIYGERNQYRVVLEVDDAFQRDPSDLSRLYVAARGATQVPLTTLAKIEKTLGPQQLNHQGQFPAVTITFNLSRGGTLTGASAAIERAVHELHPPQNLHTSFIGDAKAFGSAVNVQPMLILAAVGVIYLILGVLYESLVHPLTILSTLPSAGLGALLALQIFGLELTMIAFIGIILSMGMVLKNGIMMVDFAIAAERQRQLSSVEAIQIACRERFRPIVMTTLAAMLGAVPLILAGGAGSELRRPLGITIVGGLLVSQVLTLYTTPVIFAILARFGRQFFGART